ncbi:MAG TPA: hypothetical protein VKV15_12215 [Bryobacteraceae bacterium]|nr:hypothetical protein [Bryobacteraceae bacterium]
MSIYGKLDEVLGHCRRYSKEELGARMETRGFTVERIFDFNRISCPGWFIAGRLLKRNTISAGQLALFDRLYGYGSGWIRGFPGARLSLSRWA